MARIRVGRATWRRVRLRHRAELAVMSLFTLLMLLPPVANLVTGRVIEGRIEREIAALRAAGEPVGSEDFVVHCPAAQHLDGNKLNAACRLSGLTRVLSRQTLFDAMENVEKTTPARDDLDTKWRCAASDAAAATWVKAVEAVGRDEDVILLDAIEPMMQCRCAVAGWDTSPGFKVAPPAFPELPCDALLLCAVRRADKGELETAARMILSADLLAGELDRRFPTSYSSGNARAYVSPVTALHLAKVLKTPPDAETRRRIVSLIAHLADGSEYQRDVIRYHRIVRMTTLDDWGQPFWKLGYAGSEFWALQRSKAYTATANAIARDIPKMDVTCPTRPNSRIRSAGSMVLGVDSDGCQFRRVLTLRRMAGVAMAISLARSDGHDVSTISDLVPQYLSQAPVDPFSADHNVLWIQHTPTGWHIRSHGVSYKEAEQAHDIMQDSSLSQTGGGLEMLLP